MTFDEATQILQEAELKWKKVVVFSPRPAGQVIGQEPAAGETIVQGSVVTLRVSKGKQLVAVPDVLMQTEESAIQELAGEGFKASVNTVPSDEAEGLVVAQSPDQGTRISPGKKVTIYV